MDDLITFLNARLDEREDRARQAKRSNSGTWCVPDPGYADGRVEDDKGEVITYDEGAPTLAEARHIAAEDPNTTLADVAAKRRVIKLHRPYQVTTANDGLNWCYTRCVGCEPIDRELEPNESYWPCPTLRLLALSFASHPDYREEWRV